MTDKKDMKYAPLLYALICSHFVHAKSDNPSQDILWKARGLQAFENVEKLTKIEKAKLTKQQKCDWLLDGAFMGFSVPEMAKIVRKKTEKDDIFIMIFSDGEMHAQVSFIYKLNGSMPDFLKVPQLKDGWQFVVPSGDSKTAILMSSECIFMIDRENPIKSTALSTN